jgi:hypothetical protein
MSKVDIPINQKLAITVFEASEYSGLPVSMIRQLAKQPDCDFVFQAGGKGRGKTLLLKREQFEAYVMKH